MNIWPFLFVVFLTFGCNAFSQEPVFISYELNLRNGPARDQIESKYDNTHVTTQDSLSQRQFLELKALFLNRIYSQDSVASFIGVLGPMRPRIRTYKRISNYTQFIKSDNLCCNDEYELDLSIPQVFKSDGKDIIEKIHYPSKDEIVFKNGRIRTYIDTVISTHLYTGDSILIFERNWDLDTLISGLSFLESWNIDTSSGAFNKDIIHLGLLENKQSAITGEYTHNGHIFNFALDPKKINSSVPFAKDICYDVFFKFRNRSAYNRPNEIEGGYNTDNYISPRYRKQFLEFLFDTVRKNQIKVSNLNSNGHLDLNSDSVSVDEFFDSFTQYDYTEWATVMIESSLADIIGFRFFEDWYINTETFSFEKKVKGIQLLKESRNQKTREVQGLKPMVPYVLVFEH
jgi:hypothetical protein